MDRISRALDLARKKVTEVKAESSNVIVEVEDHLDKPVEYDKTKTVSVSAEILDRNRILTGIEDTAIVDIYGLLRTRVLKAMRQNNWRTLGITSPNPSAGKTLTAINLAISIAMDHSHTALLVDTDMRRPGVSPALGLDINFGLNNYLNKDKPLDDIFIHPQIEDLSIIPTGREKKKTSELLSSPRMIRFIEQAKQRYPDRLVLFDMPPALVGDDVVALSQNLDAVLLVVEDGETKSQELRQTAELLEDVNILGVVLNKAVIASNENEYY